MLTKDNRGLRFRTNFRYDSPEQRQRVLDYLAGLPAKAFAYENEHAKRIMICDFASESDRASFEAVKTEF